MVENKILKTNDPSCFLLDFIESFFIRIENRFFLGFRSKKCLMNNDDILPDLTYQMNFNLKDNQS